MRPEIALLRRDLRLYGGAFLLPTAVALISSIALHKANENPMTFLAFSLWIALLIPHALHIREEAYGTLGDFKALPVTPRHIVALRFLEGLMACFLVALLHIVMTLILKGPTAFQGLSAWWSPGWLWMLLLFLAIPLPITLRWGGRGWLVLIVSVFLVFGALVMLGQLEGHHPRLLRFMLGVSDGLWRTITYFARHPWQHGLLLGALCLACLPLAGAAYARRDA